jgi:hypothetical protein
VHAHNCSTQKAEAGGLKVQGQPGLHSETLSQNKQTKTNPQTTTNLLYVCNKFKH